MLFPLACRFLSGGNIYFFTAGLDPFPEGTLCDKYHADNQYNNINNIGADCPQRGTDDKYQQPAGNPSPVPVLYRPGIGIKRGLCHAVAPDQLQKHTGKDHKEHRSGYFDHRNGIVSVCDHKRCSRK